MLLISIWLLMKVFYISRKVINEFKTNVLNDYSYIGYLEYLKRKNGKVPGDYAIGKRRNREITKEGFEIHHDMENEIPGLSNKNKFTQREYQSSEHLTYCDKMEHLLLHTLIVKESDMEKVSEGKVLLGINGIINHMIPDLNSIFAQPQNNFRRKKLEQHKVVINNNKYGVDFYVKLLFDIHNILKEKNFDFESKLKYGCDGHNLLSYMFNPDCSKFNDSTQYIWRNNRRLMAMVGKIIKDDSN